MHPHRAIRGAQLFAPKDQRLELFNPKVFDLRRSPSSSTSLQVTQQQRESGRESLNRHLRWTETRIYIYKKKTAEWSTWRERGPCDIAAALTAPARVGGPVKQGNSIAQTNVRSAVGKRIPVGY